MAPKILVVCGPTATGKTALALHLARRFGGQLVSADSMQVYAGLPVGTAAVTAAEADGVRVHLTGFLPPEQAYSVADWLRDARRAIEEIGRAGGLPVVCGGTGLYIENLVKGTSFTPQETDPALRAELQAQWDADGGAAVFERLRKADPGRAAQLSPGDGRRVVRALEACLQTGQTAAQRDAESKSGAPQYEALCMGLDYAGRDALYAAIERRVDAMMGEGLLEEAQRVWQNRERYRTAAQAIGYKELFPYFSGEADLDACVGKLKQATRNYAKRQLTWFRRMEGIRWLDAQAQDVCVQAEKLAGEFLAGA